MVMDMGRIRLWIDVEAKVHNQFMICRCGRLGRKSVTRRLWSRSIPAGYTALIRVPVQRQVGLIVS